MLKEKKILFLVALVDSYSFMLDESALLSDSWVWLKNLYLMSPWLWKGLKLRLYLKFVIINNWPEHQKGHGL